MICPKCDQSVSAHPMPMAFMSVHGPLRFTSCPDMPVTEALLVSQYPSATVRIVGIGPPKEPK